MADRISAQQYRTLMGGHSSLPDQNSTIPKTAPTKKKVRSTREHLQAMGEYFVDEFEQGRAITKKSIEFYIRQTEMSGKI